MNQLFNEISSAIRALGIKKSDTILLQLDTDFFKSSEGKSKKECCDELLKTIFDIIGDEGTLITPSFNYSFCKSGKFDLHKTPSQVGYFSNYLLTKSEAMRSLHPIFSFVGIGKNAQEILTQISKDSFGAESVFDKLHQRNAKGLYINVPMDHANCPPSTFIHYIEQKHEVDYRYLKTFSGEIVAAGEKYEDSFTYNVRRLELDVKTDNIKLYNKALEGGVAKLQTISGQYPLIVIDIAALVDLGISMLKQDPYSMLEKNPN